jgi:hypothetical protein
MTVLEMPPEVTNQHDSMQAHVARLRQDYPLEEEVIIREWPETVTPDEWRTDVMAMFTEFTALPYQEIRDIKFVVVGIEKSDDGSNGISITRNSVRLVRVTA